LREWQSRMIGKGVGNPVQALARADERAGNASHVKDRAMGKRRGSGAARWGVPVALVAAAPLIALAHAILVESSPKEGQTVTAATTQAVLRFNARIEKKVTQVTLRDGAGHKLKRPPMPEDEDGPAERVVVPLPKLAAGDYVIEYQVLASDGHATPGIIRFSVVAAPASQPVSDRGNGGTSK
jgi:methionine-rich copper-binding protein CopC